MKISTTRRRAAVGLLAAVVPALVVHAGNAYLPITGPTPLRFEVARVRPPLSAFLTPPVNPSEKSGDRSPVTAGLNATNAPALPAEEILAAAPEIPPPPSLPGEAAPAGPDVIRPLTDSLLIITPQMLAEYFRPSPGATNGAGVSVFLPVSAGFTPPTEKTPVSSRATYKTE